MDAAASTLGCRGSKPTLVFAVQYEILATAPRHYVVHLNRHTHTGQLDKSGVVFDDELDLSFAAGENQKCSWLYRLYAVCFHIGSTSNTGAPPID
jgi:hypothetical protein